MQFDRYLERSAQRAPDKVAVVDGDRRLTFAELWSSARRLAAGLLGPARVLRGDRVVILLPSGLEAVQAIFGVLRAGGVFVVVHPRTPPAKLRYLLENAEASCLITDRRHARALEDTLRTLPNLRSLLVVGAGEKRWSDEAPLAIDWSALLAEELPEPPRRHISTDLAALIYTSGSTGNPKGVMVSHQNVAAASWSIITYLENEPDDVILDVLPLSFDYGLYQVLMAIRFGGTVVLEPGFTYPHAVLQKVEAEGVTGLPLVPTLAALVLQLDLTRYDLSRLRYITNTAAALPVEHIQRLRDALPQARVYSMYGLTECKRVSWLPPAELDRRPGSVGRAMPDTEAFVVDDEGSPAPPGTVGELVVRGPHVMLGYWRNPEATAARLRPGRLPREVVLHTGDLFRADDEGFLYFVGRTDDIIKSGGEKVAPREVENALYKHPRVALTAVVGVPDELLGHRIRAYVTATAGERLTEREVLQHCREHLEVLLVPHEVIVRDELPLNASGKIDKRALLASAPG
jgi:amino acid adenylation domain-containing protein